MTTSTNIKAARRAGILFLVDEMSALTAGGTERQLLQICAFARTAGFLPEIAVLRGTEWLTPEIAGCPVTGLGIGSVSSPAGLRRLWQVAQWMRRKEFALLITFFPEANLLGPWLARVAGIPHTIGTRRNLNHFRSDAPRWALRLQGLSNLLAEEIVANSQAVQRGVAATEAFAARRMRVIYNGLPTSSLQPQAEERAAIRARLQVEDHALLVGNISGLREVKGVLLFLEAAAAAHRSDPTLRFVLVGEGEMRAPLEQGIARAGLQHVFHLAGAAEHVRPFLSAFDIAVLSSHAEGFSNSLLEYMAAGLPSVATDVGGNREALADCGLIVPPNDAEAIANAILQLRDPALRSKFSAAARSRALRFDIAEAEREYVALFRRYATPVVDATHRKAGISA